ncbi:MAG TPA: hypothetical protein VEV41_20110 [Terriglobales bacterium]|nr:hypothetical protein [Terriglobales bacterium]
MPSFYFEQLLETGLNGIDQQGITAAVLQIAGVILILSLLWAVYEAYTSGGDVRLLGVAAVKYLVLGLVFLNYQSAFRAVNGMFNGVADGVYNLSGGTDAIKAWGNSLSQAWQTNPNWFSALWNMVTGGVSAIVAGLITLIGYLLLPFTYTLFTLFYALYGSILYVVGPFVLALMPSRSLGQLGRSFFVNMMIFQCWGLLYAILQSLMSALQINDPNQFGGSFLQAFVGSSQVIVMSIASVLLSIMIALIPFIASRIVHGDIGSTLMTVVSGAVTAGAVASGLAFAGGEGLAAGRTVAPEGPPPPPTGGPGATSQNTGSASQGSVVCQARNVGTGASAIGESRPPAPLNSAGGNGGAGVTASAGSQNPSAGGDSSSSPTNAVDSSATTGAGSPSALRNAKTGQLFFWNDGGWQESGHVATPAGSSSGGESGTYGSTNRTGGNAGRSARGYAGRSLTGLAAWQAGRVFGSTMRFIGMGKER